jgi:hypothetical protein
MFGILMAFATNFSHFHWWRKLPAMSSNTLKSEDKSGAAIFGSKRNTGIF